MSPYEALPVGVRRSSSSASFGLPSCSGGDGSFFVLVVVGEGLFFWKD